jgi:TonB family protein
MRTLTSDGTMYTFALAESHTSLAGALPSTVLHGLLIAAAVAAGETATSPRTQTDPIDIAWQVPVDPHQTSFPVDALGSSIWIPVTVPTDMPTMIPEIELSGVPILVDPRTLLPGAGADSLCCSSGTPVSSATVLSESEVDELPVLLAAGALRYPAVLAAARMSGSVTLEFVIDIEGRVAPEGMKVLSTTHQGFVAAAEEAVQTSRFHPAKKNGQKVPVRVRQTVTFRP